MTQSILLINFSSIRSAMGAADKTKPLPRQFTGGKQNEFQINRELSKCFQY